MCLLFARPCGYSSAQNIYGHKQPTINHGTNTNGLSLTIHTFAFENTLSGARTELGDEEKFFTTVPEGDDILWALETVTAVRGGQSVCSLLKGRAIDLLMDWI